MSKATTLAGASQHGSTKTAQTLDTATFEPIPAFRELDHRYSEGIDVSLLWDARTDQVSIVLTDERSGESLHFEIDPREALSALHHPYAYARPTGATTRCALLSAIAVRRTDAGLSGRRRPRPTARRSAHRPPARPRLPQ